MSYLDPLGQDFEKLISKSSISHTTNLSNVSTIISRLELAKSQLLTTTTTSPSSTETEGVVVVGEAALPSASDTLLPLSTFIKQSNLQSQKESKEWGNSLSKLSKSVDKKFPGPPPPLFPPSPSLPPPPTQLDNNTTPSNVSSTTTLHPTLLSISPSGSLLPTTTEEREREREENGSTRSLLLPFSSPLEISALNQTISLHLARIGAFSTLTTFLNESNTTIPKPESLTLELLEQLKNLYEILGDLKKGKCVKAIEWVEKNKNKDKGVEEEEKFDELEFSLRKEEFIRILLNNNNHQQQEQEEEEEEHDTEMVLNEEEEDNLIKSNIEKALAYGGTHFRRLLTPSRTVLICSLLTSPLFMPLSKLLTSPYSSIYQPYSSQSSHSEEVTSELCSQFSKLYLESIGLPRESPLKVVTDVGSSGCISKILKVQNVMKEKRTEWSSFGELPVQVELPLQYRFHSIFTCPVSKEQSTEQNPPMLLPCGHCIAKESLMRLARGTPTLKCPYCPVVSHVSACVKVHF
ncbi:hypothetical protein JCM3765_000595 [Sporobolomyces pararoseus]